MNYTLNDAKQDIEHEITRAKDDSTFSGNPEREWSKGELSGLRTALQYINQIKGN